MLGTDNTLMQVSVAQLLQDAQKRQQLQTTRCQQCPSSPQWRQPKAVPEAGHWQSQRLLRIRQEGHQQSGIIIRPCFKEQKTFPDRAKSPGAKPPLAENAALDANLPNTSSVLPYPTLKVPRSFWLLEYSSTFSRPIFCYSNNSPKASSKTNLKQHSNIPVFHKREHLHAAGSTWIFTKLELQLASKFA